MTCNDCGRDINDCDRYGCREVRGVAWARYCMCADPENCTEAVPGHICKAGRSVADTGGKQ